MNESKFNLLKSLMPVDVIFDFDGVILNTLPRLDEIIREISRIKKYPLPAESEIRENWGKGPLTILKKAFPNENPKELLKICNNLEFDGDKAIPLIDGAEDTLQQLKQRGLFLGIFTNRPLKDIIYYHQKLNSPFKMFDFVQCHGNLYERIYHGISHKLLKQNLLKACCLVSRFWKPDLKSFKPILKLLKNKYNIQKNDYYKKHTHTIIFVGDSLPDLKTAKKINMDMQLNRYPIFIIFVGVCTGGIKSPKEWFERGFLEKQFVIPSIVQLPAWLEGYEKWLQWLLRNSH